MSSSIASPSTCFATLSKSDGSNLTIGDEQLLRPAGADETIWIHDTETGEYICGDSDGTEYHRFGSAQAVFEDAGAYPATLPKDADVPDHLTGIKIPFIIERMFADEECPDPDTWSIIIVPHDADSSEDLALYDGEPIPFTDLAGDLIDTEETDDTAGNENETATEHGDETTAADTGAANDNANNGHPPFDSSIDALDDLSLPDLNSETDDSAEEDE